MTVAADRERWASLARFAARTAVAVGDAIVVENTAIVTHKVGRLNFATAADHAAEAAILARIAKHDPGVPVLAEESAKDELRKAERLWVVDPIDGTLNFSRGVPFYCVAIGYVEGGRVRAAAVHAPRLRETYVASEGGGATRNGIPVRVSRTRTVTEACAAASLAFREAGKKGSRFALLNAACSRVRVIGAAALEITYAGTGRLDLFVHSALEPWDVAGPSLIAREGGAKVVSLRTGEDAAWDEREVIIGNAVLVREALETMALVHQKR